MILADPLGKEGDVFFLPPPLKIVEGGYSTVVPMSVPPDFVHVCLSGFCLMFVYPDFVHVCLSGFCLCLSVRILSHVRPDFVSCPSVRILSHVRPVGFCFRAVTSEFLKRMKLYFVYRFIDEKSRLKFDFGQFSTVFTRVIVLCGLGIHEEKNNDVSLN